MAIMNNFEYQNINEIINSTQPIRGSRFFINKDRRIIVPNIIVEDDLDLSIKKDSFEMHLFYSDTSYIGSVYDIKNWEVDNPSDPSEIKLNILEDISNFSLQSGIYRIVYNFFRNLVCSEISRTKLFIAEMSKDRKEVVIALTNPNDITESNNLTNFVLEYLRPKKYLPPVVLNFGENKIVDIINITSDGSKTYFYAKLINPLPSDIDLRFECWLSLQLVKPYIDQIQIFQEIQEIVDTGNMLRGPNYNADYSFNMISETDYKSWNTLLSENVNTSQEILNKFIYGDNKPIRLNIDFSQFTNFCYYSSATERFENFFFKMQLIESYRNELTKLSTYVGSYDDIENNTVKIKNLQNKIIQGFDDWEKWMYYGEYGTDTDSIQTDRITSFPKYEVAMDYDISTKFGNFKFFSVDSVYVNTWYESIKTLSQEFDDANINALHKVLPDHILLDLQNQEFISFVNMIGQHYDVIYTYIEHILKKSLRKENPNEGISQDLIQVLTKNFGWNVSTNSNNKNIWEYALGLDSTHSSRYNVLGQEYNKTEEERSKEVWRRILNNLPYIYKTKGTSRSIKALLSAYGIPQTLLYIREYGGAFDPKSKDLGKNLYEKATYYLNINGSLSNLNQKITTPWEKTNHLDNWKYPDTVTFRWKMEPEKFYTYKHNECQTLLQKSSSNGVDWFVTINNNGTDPEKGTLTFYLNDGVTYKSASIYDEFLYDDIPLNLMIRRSNSSDDILLNQEYEIILKTGKYGKLSIEKSSSILINGITDSLFNQAWTTDGELHIGSGINFETTSSISGSIFELRYWSNPLEQNSFDNHVLAARAYNGNTPTSSFYDLQAQWKFWQPFDAESTNTILSSHPDQKNNKFYTSEKTATLDGFTSKSFESIIEVYNMDTANIGANTDYSQKIRIDNATLGGALNMHTSYERTSLKRNSIDSNRLTVAFSPQHIINEDIYESIGDVDLSDYIGSYSTIEDDEYTELKYFANEYWQKYNNRNDFNAYISLIAKFDFSVFDQIAQVLPARTNEILGLVIEPNILERSKTIAVKKLSGTKEFYEESNDIDIFPDLKNSVYDTKNAVLFIGFEEGDNIQLDVFETNEDVETKVTTEIDEVIEEGQYDIKNKQSGEVIIKKIILKPDDKNKKNSKLKFKYNSTGATLNTKISDDSLSVLSKTYKTNLRTTNNIKTKANMIDINGFGKIDLSFSLSKKRIFPLGSSNGQVSNYQQAPYYDTIQSINDSNYVKNVGYVSIEGSNYESPYSYGMAKRNREFYGCNDYVDSFRRPFTPEYELSVFIQDSKPFFRICENFERPYYEFNEISSLKYENVKDYQSGNVLENNIFPVSEYWKTEIRGNFLLDEINKNVYGMKNTAPRIIKLDTSNALLTNKKLFSPRYLQESVINDTSKYLNYPTSPQYVRSFPWVLTWSGSNSNIPNLGPDYGFTADLYIDTNKTAVSNPKNNPSLQY
jgi:hypothetical protein